MAREKPRTLLNRIARLIFIFLVGTVLVLAIVVFLAYRYPTFLMNIFFDINTAPVELVLRESFAPRESDAKTAAIVSAARTFLDSLNDDQRQAATYPFSDNEQRSRWSKWSWSVTRLDSTALSASSFL